MDKAISIFIDVFTKNPLTVTLAILGVVCVGLAIIGRIPPMDIRGIRAVALGAFGVLLIVVAIGLAWLLAASLTLQPQQTPIAVQPTFAPTYTPPSPQTGTGVAPSKEGKCPSSSQEAAAFWGGPTDRWKPCPSEPGCWNFSHLGRSYRISVHKSYLLPSGTIEGWRIYGQGGDDPKGPGYPGSPDLIEGDYYIWEKL